MPGNDLLSPDRSTLGDRVLFGLLCAIWGSTYFFVAIALREVGPALLALLRMGLATVVLAVLVVNRGVRLPRRFADYAWITLLSVVNVAVPFNLLTWAQLHVTSALTAILSSTTPILMFVLTTLVVREEAFSWRRLAGIMLSFGGITYLFLGNVSGPLPNAVAGQVAILISSVFYACGNLLAWWTTGRRSVAPLAAAFLQCGFAFLLQIPVVVAMGEFSGGALTLGPAIAILWLGLVASGVAYLLYFHLNRAWGPMRASMNTYYHPLVAVVLGVLVLGEVLTWRAVLCMIAILGGVLTFSLAPVGGDAPAQAPHPPSDATD